MIGIVAARPVMNQILNLITWHQRMVTYSSGRMMTEWELEDDGRETEDDDRELESDVGIVDAKQIIISGLLQKHSKDTLCIAILFINKSHWHLLKGPPPCDVWSYASTVAVCGFGRAKKYLRS